MKRSMMKLLFELLKDSKRSDRELAKVLDVSQATVSRMRNKLVRDGVIREFTVIPDFTKMGFELLAIISCKSESSKEIAEKQENGQCQSQMSYLQVWQKAWERTQ